MIILREMPKLTTGQFARAYGEWLEKEVEIYQRQNPSIKTMNFVNIATIEAAFEKMKSNGKLLVYPLGLVDKSTSHLLALTKEYAARLSAVYSITIEIVSEDKIREWARDMVKEVQTNLHKSFFNVRNVADILSGENLIVSAFVKFYKSLI
jgi:hypothetical protein